MRKQLRGTKRRARRPKSFDSKGLRLLRLAQKNFFALSPAEVEAYAEPPKNFRKVLRMCVTFPAYLRLDSMAIKITQATKGMDMTAQHCCNWCDEDLSVGGQVINRMHAECYNRYCEEMNDLYPDDWYPEDEPEADYDAWTDERG